MKQGPSRRLCLVAFAAVLCAACDTPGVTLVDPDVSNPEDQGTTIHVTLEDSALAEALGWSQGVPNAELQLHRMIEAFQPDHFYTDSTGHVHVPERMPGYHLVAAFKSITADEAAAAGAVPRVFADGLKTEFLGNTLQLALGGDQRGSLVISETYSGGRTYGIDYQWAAFWELYNNSDTTVYLDGMLLGRAFGGSSGAIFTCEELRQVREHPEGLVAFDFHQFPGTGHEHPVAPGQAVTIAVDAVDHSQAHPTLPDLTIADYELEGSGDPDNPDVPNVPPAGLNTDILGHGMQQFEFDTKFLALPVDPASLTTIPFGRYRWSLVPTDRIIDVQHAEYMHPESPPHPELFYPCPRWVNREFDRLEAASDKAFDHDNATSLQRRILRYTPDGRAILQDTDVSYFDFVIAKYSPGSVEY
ncbi:MAG: hypothetical protein AMS18_07555 [Gemmatimonas sp. SG8_17]|nr:MAG: hypothetical protein AMS18_07555 [Gemmatimonas sp. SG8_17]